MSWRLAFHSGKVLFSYLFPYKLKQFREAIFDGKLELIRELADGRPRLAQQAIDADGNTALGLALLLGEVEVVKVLLEIGSDPNIANAFDGNHPLVFLAKLRQEESSKTALLADLLLDGGSDPLQGVRYQADTRTRVDATQTPSFNETPLLCVVRYQNEDLLKKFIEHNVDINALNEETGTSPLMLASALGYLNICNLLLDNGADIHAADHSGNTPIHFAAQGYGEQTDCLQALLQRGADVNATNEEGFTAAMLAKNQNNEARFKLLDSHTIDKPLHPPTYDEVESVNDQNVFSFT